jgi:hypothetical protein
MQDEMKNTSTVSNENRPISPWEYFARDVLYGLPFIGLIVALVCAFDKNNINVRNHARSRLIFVIIWFAFVLAYIAMIFIAFGGAHLMQ